MSFFKSIFGLGVTKIKERRLDHPKDLRRGDIIKFQFIDQSEVSGKEYEVSIVNTYIYGNICYPELVLKDRNSNVVYLMVEEEDGEEYISISKKVPKGLIDEVIRPVDISKIINGGTGTKLVLENIPSDFSDWTVSRYKKVDHNIKGSFVKGDARYLSDEELRKNENFVSHILEDKRGEYGLEVEIYESGEVELSITVYHKPSVVDEMWPGDNK